MGGYVSYYSGTSEETSAIVDAKSEEIKGKIKVELTPEQIKIIEDVIDSIIDKELETFVKSQYIEDIVNQAVNKLIEKILEKITNQVELKMKHIENDETTDSELIKRVVDSIIKNATKRAESIKQD